MKASQLFSPTLRETPAEAEVVSHQLMVRGGYVRRAAAGVYTYLPLANRVLKKISEIVREEMNRQGGQEISLPIIQPAELWQESGRWNVYGDELFRLKDRHGREFALGPTHEEIITDLVRNEVHSYKQLPLLLYQVANKYRDERRPRFGLMRGREFIMKDLYSFDRNEARLEDSYQKMYRAYGRIFGRCGLSFRPVEADSGAIGGSSSHEFMVLADSGEAEVVYCEACDYAANTEKAEAMPDKLPQMPVQEVQAIDTPNSKTIGEVAEVLKIETKQLIKTLIYEADQEFVVALVRGDRQLNEIKLLNAINTVGLELARDEVVRLITGADTGFAGPIGLPKNVAYNGKQWPVTILADLEIPHIPNGVVGGNKTDVHIINVNYGRDFTVDKVLDLRSVAAGEGCPKCSAPLHLARGIEVGQVFKLGTKYSKALGATFLDENGKSQDLVMGCYGIGVSRTMAAAIEQNNDADGIVWPVSIAPYQVVVVPVSAKDETQMVTAETIYQELLAQGIEVVLDDRNERPGVKFKDADLIGYPVRITIGPKTLEQGGVEIRLRHNGESTIQPVNEAVAVVKGFIQGELSTLAAKADKYGE